MPHEFGRNRRLSKEIQRELAPLVQSITAEISGTMASVTEVDVSPDLRQATVYISCYGAQPARALETVQAAANHLRHHLATRLHTRIVPAIRVELDGSIERGAQMSALLNSLKKADPDSTS